MPDGDRGRRAGPAPRLIGAFAEPLYSAAVAYRNRRYDAGHGTVDLGAAVISVGNLSVGGSGKTPMVMRIVHWLLEIGARPAIAMRGYKAQAGQWSDEEAEYRERFPQLPVIAQPDRAAGLRPLIESGSIDCAVLDDGFQHRRLARSLDIVLVDVSRNPFTDRLLPAGWLREPVTALARADLVILTHVEACAASEAEGIAAQIAAVRGSPPEAWTRHSWSELRARRASLALASLNGRAVVVACAIGNPEAFVSAVRAAGADVVATLCRRDHHRWNRRDAAELVRLARADSDTERPWVVTTEKDWVKLRELPEALLPLEVVRPHLELTFDRGEALVRAAVERAVSAGTL